MAEIKILVKGYAREENGIEFASSTATLIKDGGLNIIVDSGMNREMLLVNLVKENLSIKDIDFVVLTHTHLDHCLLAGIFGNAKVLDNSNIFSFDGKIDEHDGKVPNTEIEIIRTPGHDQFHCSVLVRTESQGVVVIAGDVFWWADEEKQKIDRQSLFEHKDPYVKDPKALQKSREKVLGLADYIIPGHGEMFKVNK
ncbi:MAG: MBL fold metallo-hydrolase [Candidatus Pacebacteria bacterium]|nr:MBL fold metallo-hydrolase [Candidatus Paceibacterota bacterium]